MIVAPRRRPAPRCPPVADPPARAAAARRRRRIKRRLSAAAVVVVGVLVVGFGVAYANSGTSGHDYRLATAALGNVQQTATSAGTVSSADKAVAAFSVAGTVKTVGVTIGQTVTAGQVLGT